MVQMTTCCYVSRFTKKNNNDAITTTVDPTSCQVPHNFVFYYFSEVDFWFNSFTALLDIPN